MDNLQQGNRFNYSSNGCTVIGAEGPSWGHDSSGETVCGC